MCFLQITDCEERNTAVTRIKERVKRKSSGDYLSAEDKCLHERKDQRHWCSGATVVGYSRKGRRLGPGTGQSCR